MSLVALVKCESKQDAEIAVNKCLEYLGWDKINTIIKKGIKVLIKPNICCAKSSDTGATTHSEIVEAIIKIVLKNGAIPIIGDGPAWGAGGNYFGVTGLTALAQKYNIRLVNLNQDGFVEKKLDHVETVVFKTARISKTAADADIIIDLPVCKTSGACLFSGALKNMKGVLSGVEKHKPHIFGINEGIVEVNQIIKPQLIIMDGIVGMEGEGPANGIPIHLGIMLASLDPVAIDFAACKIMQFDPKDIPYLHLAEKRNLGNSQFQIVGEDLASISKKCIPPHTYENKFLRFMIGKVIFKKIFPVLEKFSKIKIDLNKCIFCGACEKSCPVHAIHLVPKAKSYEITYSACIGCMCCHEVCPKGAPYMSKAILRTAQRKMWGGKLGASGLAEFNSVDLK